MRLVVPLLLSVCFACGTPVFASETDDYVTGMAVVGGHGSACPPIVWFVTPDTPAAKAGIKPGDRLLAIDGHYVNNVAQASRWLHSKEPTFSIIELDGKSGPYTVTVTRIKLADLLRKRGLKEGPDGNLFPLDASEVEMQRVTKMLAERNFPPPTVFDGHYPSDLSVYYPGFEVFVWDQPNELTVGGIENGPAQRAGVHYADSIVSVNGVNPKGKTIPELEKLFSSPNPANMTLVVERDGGLKRFTFALEKASEVAKDNKRAKFEGKLLPSVLGPYLHCGDASFKH